MIGVLWQKKYVYTGDTRTVTPYLVVKLNSAGNSFSKGEATGLGLDVLDFVPPLLGDVLGHQGVGGLDGGEFSGHVDNCSVKYCC